MIRKIAICFFILIISAFVYLPSFVISSDSFFEKANPLLFKDFARLEPEMVLAVDKASTTEQLVNIIKDAKERGLKVSISGSRHSQGGHTYTKGGVTIDMRDYDKILSVNKEKQQIVVQAGATWDEVQREINKYGLAIKVMQSSNIFTVGGTMSSNAHGRDLDKSSVIETVESFRLLKADGTIVNVSRTENQNLFNAVIGGYGLFGVILDVTLDVTKNDLYIQKSVLINYKDLPSYFEKNIKNNEDIKMMLARPSIAKNSFIDEVVVITWSLATATATEQQDKLSEEENVWRDRLFFGLSRKFDWAKDLRWYLQKKVELGVGEIRTMTRNNAMRPPLAPLEFLEYYSKNDTDIIQEYYIPISKYEEFMDNYKYVLLSDKVNVISFTIRYVKANNEAMLSYCPKEDCFAIILMTNVGLDFDSQSKIEKTTQDIVDEALKVGGTYYLTYQNYPTRDQLIKAYPRFEEFLKLKKMVDPQELFVSKFYKKYEK